MELPGNDARGAARVGRPVPGVLRAARPDRMGDVNTKARSRKAAETRRTTFARSLRDGARFTMERPCRVESFTGGMIRTGYSLRPSGGATRVTDFHVVDARGRTLHVYTRPRGQTLGEVHRRAERLADALNAL